MFQTSDLPEAHLPRQHHTIPISQYESKITSCCMRHKHAHVRDSCRVTSRRNRIHCSKTCEPTIKYNYSILWVLHCGKINTLYACAACFHLQSRLQSEAALWICARTLPPLTLTL